MGLDIHQDFFGRNGSTCIVVVITTSSSHHHLVLGAGDAEFLGVQRDLLGGGVVVVAIVQLAGVDAKEDVDGASVSEGVQIGCQVQVVAAPKKEVSNEANEGDKSCQILNTAIPERNSNRREWLGQHHHGNHYNRASQQPHAKKHTSVIGSRRTYRSGTTWLGRRTRPSCFAALLVVMVMECLN